MSSVFVDDCLEELLVVINKYKLEQYEVFGILEVLKETIIIDTIKGELK